MRQVLVLLRLVLQLHVSLFSLSPKLATAEAEARRRCPGPGYLSTAGGAEQPRPSHLLGFGGDDLDLRWRSDA